jgi:hypothetical protein
MLTRTMAAMVLPGRRWLSASREVPQTAWIKLDRARLGSLSIQDRVELRRERCIQRHGWGGRR